MKVSMSSKYGMAPACITVTCQLERWRTKSSAR